MSETVILWSHPRSRSTALERAFIEREDFYVIHEPLSLYRYKGANEDDILNALLLLPNSITYSCLKEITYMGTLAKNIFIKEFPYHSMNATIKLLSKPYKHIFLVRDPLSTIFSWQKIYPEFEEYELGYKELLETIRHYIEIYNETPLIIHSDELQTNADQIMRKVCKHTKINYVIEMCNWSQREKIDAWNVWDQYHKEATNSTGFLAKTRNYKVNLSDRNKKYLEITKPYYDDICKYAI